MRFDPTLAAIRFGTGLSPTLRPAPSVSAMLDDLAGPDLMDAAFPVPGYDAIEPSLAALQRSNKLRRDSRGTPQEAESLEYFRTIRRAGAAVRVDTNLSVIARNLDTRFGLRERLTAFWADHFTVVARSSIQSHFVTAYAEDAVRPYVVGRFGDMLRSVVLHPMMLTYLEQWRSTGPQSELGQRMGRGLNENLARELLELHLLGVDGGYDQTDVRELAELLTGLVYHSRRGFYYDPRMAEPGTEQVLGVTFGAEATLSNILVALDTLAMHPETAHHLAQKMAVHFIGADPDPAMVAKMAQSYLNTGGNLMAMTVSMLRSDSAWVPEKTKVRLPMEFMMASMRALGMTGADAIGMHHNHYRNLVVKPLRVMGQPWQKPIGPDGWSEDPADWIIPQAMAGRITWAMSAPQILRETLPDPRDFAHTALGAHVTPQVQFAAGAAETQAEGVGIVLASAAFQRR